MHRASYSDLMAIQNAASDSGTEAGEVFTAQENARSGSPGFIDEETHNKRYVFVRM
jgi:hypothetical protein